MNQAVGTTRSFHVSRAAIRAIRDYVPRSFDEYQETLAHAGGVHTVKGVICFRDKIVFTGFPDTKVLDYTDPGSSVLNITDSNISDSSVSVPSVSDSGISDSLFTGQDRKHAFRTLAQRIVVAAFTKQWTTPFSKSDSRIDRFRSWLYSLGLSGNEHAKTRQILLENFKTNV